MDDWLHSIGAAFASEFSDVPDLEQAARIVVRLCVAALLGGLLGWEREAAGKAAGVRTHMLVAMGAALFMLVSQQSGIEPADNSRVLQGVIAGVGFLCAGTILKGDAESQVKGLTTAAGIWLTAAIGVAAGLGQETTAIITTVLALLVLWLVPLLHTAITGKPHGDDTAPPVPARPGARRRHDDDEGGEPPADVG